MKLSYEQIQDLLRVGNPSAEECRLIRMGWDAALARMRTKSVPEGWLRAIDEALVTAHIGVANAHDTYEQAKAKLDNLIGFHTDVATDPAVNGGWKLVPIEVVGLYNFMCAAFVPMTPQQEQIAVQLERAKRAMLAAAPESKP